VVDGREPDVQPHVQGASRGTGDRRDAERAGDGERRAGANNEYAANAEPGEEELDQQDPPSES
jgi:hypothetical protein